MEGAPATNKNSGDDGLAARSHQPPAQPDVNGDGASIDGGFTEEFDRNSGGNRWPRQETLALIRIRSEMDAAFRDSNLKAPLWDEVSRKLSNLGFHRSAKKCREKFENVYKYHRRTKEGRTSKPDKIYRFSDELQALESNHRAALPSPPALAVKPPPVLVSNATIHVHPPYNRTGSDQNNVSPISVAAPAPVVNHKRSFPFLQSISGFSDSGSLSGNSEDEPPLKKKKWEGFFEGLVKELIEKQEELQMKFVEIVDRRERDRLAKEEAWRAQEILKLNQEYDRLVAERSIVAAKDAAIVVILQKLAGKSFDSVPVIDDEVREKPTAIQQQLSHKPSPLHDEVYPPAEQPLESKNLDGCVHEEESKLSPSPSRWPKAEINALITLRSKLDVKYQENVPKGPLWEEISVAMRNLGYNRNAKRCKEKWENINKYYKKIKEGNKKRSEDSKTCPYFDQLEALYKEKSTLIVAEPEQQWPPAAVVVQKAPPPTLQWQNTNVVQTQNNISCLDFTVKSKQQQQPLSLSLDMEDHGSDDSDNFDNDEGDDDKEDEDEDGVCEIIGSKISSMAGF
ncbi:hypothetical protein E3N88_10713 [Mikania micrantha]|uniref:Myb-like domain-containing protein n=1 Tax=Mikania micrantha TaxID=192012 RepID=A0A5N6PD61_9ASTR|nr:hypothetical protein E3N88_10713 [Mikania micrantha]